MSGVYGDFLLAFPEQYRTVTVYSMTPKINGGWTIDENSSLAIKGIYQDTEARACRTPTETSPLLIRWSSGQRRQDLTGDSLQ